MTLSCKAQAFSVANLLKPSPPREDFGAKHHLRAHHHQIFDALHKGAQFAGEDVHIDRLSPDRNNVWSGLTPGETDSPAVSPTDHGKLYTSEIKDELNQSRGQLFCEKRTIYSSGVVELNEGPPNDESRGSRSDARAQRVVEVMGRLGNKPSRRQCPGHDKKGHEPARLTPGSSSLRRQRSGAGEGRGGTSSAAYLTGETCFCHGEISYCHHPGVQTVTDSHDPEKAILVELCHADLWTSFHRLGTEMIITKSGRRMFPSMKMRVSGLNPDASYTMRLEFVQPDTRKYRYMYHSSRWMVSGSGDAMPTPPCHVNPEGPISGQAICSQIVSFERLKMTNTESTKPGQVSLVSMQKFQPQVVIEEISCGRTEESSSREHYVIMFPQTSFMAVTAYQNQQITTLKIASNPFAKGFRESGKTRVPYEAIMGSYPNIISFNTGVTYLPGLPLLSGMYPSRGSNTRKRCYSESVYDDTLEMEKKSQILKMEAHKSMSFISETHPSSLNYQNHPAISRTYNYTSYGIPEMTSQVVQEVLSQQGLSAPASSEALTRSATGFGHSFFAFSKRSSDIVDSNPKTGQTISQQEPLQFLKIKPPPVSPSPRQAAVSGWSHRRHPGSDATLLFTDLQNGRFERNAHEISSSHQGEDKNDLTRDQTHFRSRSVTLGRSSSALPSSPRCKTEPSRTIDDIIDGSDVINRGTFTVDPTLWSNSFSPFQPLHKLP